MGFKIPRLVDDHKSIIQQFERNRNSKLLRPIEFRLSEITRNANLNTTDKKPLPSNPERDFRAYVDNQIDLMSRLSVHKLKNKILTANTQLENDLIAEKTASMNMMSHSGPMKQSSRSLKMGGSYGLNLQHEVVPIMAETTGLNARNIAI